MANRETADSRVHRFSAQAYSVYDPRYAALWIRTNPAPRPCYNPELLDNLLDFCCAVQYQGTVGAADHTEGIFSPSTEYVIMASDRPGVFMLGGDLELFATLIERQEREELLHYGRICVDIVHRIYHNYFQPVTTVALVQGECLGGGFEAAIAHDVIIAEQQSRFGFPEIRFNLFPGMGAATILERRIGRVAATKIIESGEIYSAEEMQKMGILDIIVPEGAGESEVEKLIFRRRNARNGLEALARVRRHVHPVDHRELQEIVEIWTDAALRLTARDLKMMRRLAQRQSQLFVPHDAPAATEEMNSLKAA